MRQPGSGRTPLFPLLLLMTLLLGVVAGVATISYTRGPGHNQAIVGFAFPHEQFPGKDHLNILVMGIDDNWTNRDQMYTKGARTDTLMVVSLDLKNQTARMLSIPRDSRVRIAGTHHWGKINGAFATGGPARAIATVENFLDVPIDHYVVLKIDATRKLVDAVGGVDLNVEKDMKYNDNWGHLHIDLKMGMQHLTGEQAVGYIRFRHDREGDFGRIRRQQQLLHAIADKIKGDPLLINTVLPSVRDTVNTDLTDGQISALAEIFRGVNTSRIVTGYIPGSNQKIDGVWFLIPKEDKKKQYVDWLLKGDASAENPLVQVAVENGCGSQAASRAVRSALADAGFDAYLDGAADRSDYQTTRVIDFDRLKGAGALVANALGLSSSPVIQPDPQADSSVVVIVGRDLATSTLASRASGN